MARPRITYDVPEEIRRALLVFAAETDQTVGAVIEQMTRQFMPDHVDRARKLIGSQADQPKPKGRPPKKP